MTDKKESVVLTKNYPSGNIKWRVQYDKNGNKTLEVQFVEGKQL